jgi:hypothetical protein
MQDLFAHPGRAGEGDLVDPRMHGERRPGIAQPGQDVDDAFGHAGLKAQFAKTQGRQGRLLGRLHHHGAAAGQHRRRLPHRHADRPVPRVDRGDHAHRLLQVCDSTSPGAELGSVSPEISVA